MGRAETVTLLGLDRYAEVMQINLCHFNQVNNAKVPLGSGCDRVWSQQDREDLAITIAQAEEMIAEFLGFWPAPKFIEDEDIWIGRVRSDWWNAEINTRWGYLQNFGTQTLTLIQANAPVTYRDDVTDYYDREETALLGSAATLYTYIDTTCTDPCDVKAFFRVEDGAWDPADPRWEIRSLKADVDDGNLTIKAESCLFVKPSLWELTPAANPDDAWVLDFDINNLVEAVDLYCESVNTQLPLTIKYDGLCQCASPCAHTTQTGCAHITDRYQGTFTARPASWSGSAHAWASPTVNDYPEKVTVNYYAGYPRDSRTCRMNPLLERAVIKLTNVLLPEPPCGFCDEAQTRWKNDRQKVDPLTTEVIGLPWAMYESGALEAFKIVKRFALGQGRKLGR